MSCGIGGVNCSIDWGIDRSQLFAQVEAAFEEAALRGGASGCGGII